jgi:hypothetical protein
MQEPVSQLELALQEALRHQLDPLVHQAEQDAALLEGSGMEKNQIRNVLNVADESRSLAVVANFIRYQLGRSQTGPAWRKNGFGLRVIEQIEASGGIIVQQTQAAVKRAAKRVAEIPQEAIDELRYDMMRYYLGYLNRAFIYGKETRKWQDLRRSGEEG